MQYFRLIIQLGFLFIFYLLGVMIQKVTHLPIPGSVLGMILLFICLLSGFLKMDYIKIGAQFMIKHLVLFFIPATVGIISYYKVFMGSGIWLIFIAVGSTLMVMLTSGWLSQLLAKEGEPNE